MSTICTMFKSQEGRKTLGINIITKPIVAAGANAGAAVAVAAIAKSVTLGAGAIFGAVSAPLAYGLFFPIQLAFNKALKITDQDSLKAKRVELLAGLIAAVAAIVITAAILTACGMPINYGMAFALGSPMIAFVFLKYLIDSKNLSKNNNPPVVTPTPTPAPDSTPTPTSTLAPVPKKEDISTKLNRIANKAVNGEKDADEFYQNCKSLARVNRDKPWWDIFS